MQPITNIRPKQIKPIPWGWVNKTMPDGSLWVSESPGFINMPRLIDFFDFSSWETENIRELESHEPTVCTVNMKSVFTTAGRFLGTEKTMMALIDGDLDLQSIAHEMYDWNNSLLASCPEKIDRFIVGDEIGMSTGMMISPDLYRKWILPIHTMFARLAVSYCVEPWYHSDGDITEVLPDIRRAGFIGVYYEDCGDMIRGLRDAGLCGVEVVR